MRSELKMSCLYWASPTLQIHKKMNIWGGCYVAIDKWKSACSRGKQNTTAFHIITIRERNLLHTYKILLKARPHKFLKSIRKLYIRQHKENLPSLNILFLLYTAPNSIWKIFTTFASQSSYSVQLFWVSCQSFFVAGKEIVFLRWELIHDTLLGRLALIILE